MFKYYIISNFVWIFCGFACELEHEKETNLERISEFTKSVLGYGFDAATAVSSEFPESYVSNVTNKTEPNVVYANTRIKAPER